MFQYLFDFLPLPAVEAGQGEKAARAIPEPQPITICLVLPVIFQQYSHPASVTFLALMLEHGQPAMVLQQLDDPMMQILQSLPVGVGNRLVFLYCLRPQRDDHAFISKGGSGIIFWSAETQYLAHGNIISAFHIIRKSGQPRAQAHRLRSCLQAIQIGVIEVVRLQSTAEPMLETADAKHAGLGSDKQPDFVGEHVVLSDPTGIDIAIQTKELPS